MIRRSLLAVTLLLSAVAGRATEMPLPPPGASDRIDAIQRRGSLRVAVLAEFPWLVRQQESAAPFAGPAWRLAEVYAHALKVRLDVVLVTFADKIAVLSSDAADLTAAPLLVTPEREALADFIPYSTSAQCLFGLADDPRFAAADGIDDLNRPGVSLAFVDGTPSEAWLSHRFPAATRYGVAGSAADIPIAEILSHRADAAPIDKFFFAGLSKTVPGLATLPKGDACLASREMEIPVGLAVAKGQTVFLAWLRSVSEAVQPEIAAEQARVISAGE